MNEFIEYLDTLVATNSPEFVDLYNSILHAAYTLNDDEKYSKGNLNIHLLYDHYNFPRLIVTYKSKKISISSSNINSTWENEDYGNTAVLATLESMCKGMIYTCGKEFCNGCYNCSWTIYDT